MRSPFPSAVATLLAASLLAGCATSRRVSYEPEEFDSTTTHTHSYAATEAQTCEAARRALLSQGYMLMAGNAETVTGRKSFQPDAEVHVEVEFRVVCARDVRGKSGTGSTLAFASALQDRYGIKKVNNSASVGVGALGSLSLPFSSSDDALVKVASETLTDERFYDRFFALLDRYLPAVTEAMPAAAVSGASAVPARVAPQAPAAAAPVAPAAPAPATAPVTVPAPAEPTSLPVSPSPTRG